MEEANDANVTVNVQSKDKQIQKCWRRKRGNEAGVNMLQRKKGKWKLALKPATAQEDFLQFDGWMTELRVGQSKVEEIESKISNIWEFKSTKRVKKYQQLEKGS